MIDPSQLERTRAALRIVRRLELDSYRWATVATLIHELLLALHARDEPRLRKALAGLEETGVVRGGGLTSPGDDTPFPVVTDLANGAPPAGVLTRLEELAAELVIAVAEIHRVPHIDIDRTPPLQGGTRFTARVWLDATPPRDGEQASAFVLRNPPADLRKLSVDVWLTGTAHFVIEGPATATIEVRPAEPRSTEARFAVAVRDPVPADAGPPALRATFDYHLRASGSVRREILVADGGQPQEAPGEAESGSVLIHGRAAAPDLEVVIKRDTGQGHHYLVLLRTSLLGGITVTGSWILGEGAENLVRRTMAGFADEAATPTGRQRSLEGAGLAFFEAAPECFKELYWRMVDAGAPPKSMFLVSDEPAIPWELMIPRRRVRGQPWQTMTPLGVSCAIGRWHQEEHFSPGQRLPLSDSMVLAPDYPGERKLPHSRAERDLVLRHFAGHAVPGTFDELDAFYATHHASLLHFVCHGADSTLQAILLLRNQTLSAQQARSGGLAQACQQRHPLVFLNACELGRPGLGLASVGGFPAAFIACDAGAVIAPLWAVDDGVAHQVAVRFYQALLDDPSRPFADVMRLIRARAYERGGADSFGAYCFYGDPLAAMEPL